MSAPIDNGGPAFPEVTTTYVRDGAQDTQYVHSEGGMSLRDYFAAKAMQGMWASDQPGWHCSGTPDAMQKRAEAAYEMADAMLAARQS